MASESHSVAATAVNSASGSLSMADTMRTAMRGGAGFLSGRGTSAGRIGGLVLALLVAAALLAPWLAPHDPTEQIAAPFQSPAAEHWLGTNDLGQDLLSELIHGARGSLLICFSVGLLAVVAGTCIGVLSGYLRGVPDAVLMRLVDVTLSTPLLPLAIVVAAFASQKWWVIVLLLAALLWARPARTLRSAVLAARERPHVEAGRSLGASDARILQRYILPAVSPLVIAEFVRVVSAALLIETALAFLGLGDPTRESWGTTLYDAASRGAFLSDTWLWWVVPPGLLVSLVALSLIFIGMHWEQRADPRLAGADARGPISRPSARPPAPPGPTIAASGLLAVRELSVVYPGDGWPVAALRGVDLDVERGQIVGITGESGCGKTTLAMSLLGMVRPPGAITRGGVFWQGQNILELSPAELRRHRGRRIALIPQASGTALDPCYTARDLVAEVVRAHHRVTRRAAALQACELLAGVGLSSEQLKRYPHELSGGMRKRVAVAQALAGKPELIVADEPTVGLDALAQRRLLNLLADLRSRYGVALLVISHDLPMLAEICDRLLVMYAGRVVEQGDTREIVATPKHPYSRVLLAAGLPAGERRHREALPSGDLPVSQRVPTGCCAFHSRCPEAFAPCRKDDPLLKRLPGERRLVACHLHEVDHE